MATLRESGWLFVLLGIGMFFGELNNRARMRRRVVKTKGEVVEAESRWWKKGDDGSRPVKIRFYAGTGERVFLTLDTRDKYQIGQQVEVNYEPMDPQNAALTEDYDSHVLSLVMLFAGFVLEVLNHS
jgi:uncharacterized protein DUF3592